MNLDSCGDGLLGVLCRINGVLGAVLPVLIALVLFILFGE